MELISFSNFLFVVTFYFSVIVLIYDTKLFAVRLNTINQLTRTDYKMINYLTIGLDVFCYCYQINFWFHYFNIL